MDSKCLLKVEENGPRGSLDEEFDKRGEEEKLPKNDSEVSGLKTCDQAEGL